jgi:hypothetical protein
MALVGFLRRAEHDQSHPLRCVKSRTASVALAEGSRDMQLVLKHQGHHEEAAWVRNLTQELFPRDAKLWKRSRRERLTVDGRPLPSL